MIDRLRAGAEQATSRARESVQEAQLRHELGVAYADLGRGTFALIEQGAKLDERLGAGVALVRKLEAELAALGAPASGITRTER